LDAPGRRASISPEVVDLWALRDRRDMPMLLTARQRTASQIGESLGGSLMKNVSAVQVESTQAEAASFGPPHLVSKWEVLPRLEKGHIGRRHEDGTISVDRSEPPDLLLYGPYWRLVSGRYRLELRCRVRRPRWHSQPVLGVEVIVQNRVQQTWRDFTADELASGEGAIDFDVPPELGADAGGEARFEFRLYHLRNADLTIHAVDLHRLKEADAALPPRRWRLIGRQRLMWRVRRDGTGRVRIGRWRMPGTALHGSLPILSLPEGTYRLMVQGHTVMRRDDAPGLGVEVIARPWSGRSETERDRIRLCAADFTSAELASGGVIQFCVPADFAIESGDHVPIVVSVIALDGRGFLLDGLTIYEVQDEHTGVASPARWRLAGWLRSDVRGRTDIGFHVRVGREERPGVFLRSRRLHLSLHPGHFRLSFNATAEYVRDLRQPVLAVELTAEPLASPTAHLWWGPRSASVSFLKNEIAASSLATGAVELDFIVPAELDDDFALCSLVFRHFGNADLTLDALELQEIICPEIPSSAGRGPVSRRDVLIIGNCQAASIRLGFERAAPLRTRFKVKYQFVDVPEYLNQRSIQELREASLLLVQDIQEWKTYPLKQFIPDDIDIIHFPLLYFASAWPFDQYSGLSDPEAHEREWPNLRFSYLDGLLGRLRHQIPDHEARFTAYRDLNIDGIVNYVRLHDFERRRLLRMDGLFGGGIGNYILDNFQTKQLFYTIAHPNGDLLSKLIQRLVELLGIDEPIPFVADLDHLKRQQVPIHPKVARALGITWADEKTLYAHEGLPITWEAYIRSYIAHYG
jgi:hypothetical protein